MLNLKEFCTSRHHVPIPTMVFNAKVLSSRKFISSKLFKIFVHTINTFRIIAFLFV